MPLIPGDKLTPTQRREVLRAFVYRWTFDNPDRRMAYGYCPHCDCLGGKPSEDNIESRQVHPTIPLISDEEWLGNYAFHFNQEGELMDKPAEPFCCIPF